MKNAFWRALREISDLLDAAPIERLLPKTWTAENLRPINWDQLEGVVLGLLDSIEGLFKSSRDAADARSIALDAVRALLDVIDCWRGLHRHQSAAWLVNRLQRLQGILQAGHVGVDRKTMVQVEAIALRLHFYKADLILDPIVLWDNKNDDFEAGRALRTECENTIRECDAGLKLARESDVGRDSYFTFRSLFRSQRARALALTDRFSGAFVDLDRATAGLNPQMSVHRLALSIRHLLAAETHMYFSDFQILRSGCLVKLENDLQNAKGREDPVTWTRKLSPAGRFFLGFPAFSKTLGMDHEDPAGRLLRRVMTPWIDQLDGDSTRDTALDKVRRHVEEGIELVRTIDPRMAEHGQAVFKAIRSRELWSAWKKALRLSQELVGEDTRNATRALRRSLAYWDSKTLDGLGTGIGERAGLAWRSLHRAADALAEAESLMDANGRNIRAWFVLHSFSGQLHFEELLMLLTVGPQAREGDSAEDPSKHALQRFHAQFISRSRLGLQSLREARNNLLRRRDPSAPPDNRLINLRRLWLQFVFAAACNAWIRERQERRDRRGKGTKDKKWRESVFEDYWGRWRRIEQWVGFDDLDLIDEKTRNLCERYLANIFEVADEVEDYSLGARAFVERHLKLFCTPMVSIEFEDVRAARGRAAGGQS